MPAIFAIEADIPEIEIRSRKDVLLIETLEFAFHEIRQIVAAGEELRSESGTAVRIQTVISVECRTGRRKVIQPDIAVGCAISDRLIVRNPLQKDSALHSVLSPYLGHVVAHTWLEFF